MERGRSSSKKGSGKARRVASQGKPPGGKGIFERKERRRMERKQKKQKKAEYFAKRHIAIKRQVEQMRNSDKYNKHNRNNFNKNPQNQKKRQNKEQNKRSNTMDDDDFDLFQADDNEEITSEESFVQSSEPVVKQKKPVVVPQEEQIVTKPKKSVKFSSSVDPKLDEEKKEIHKLERLLGIKDNEGKATRLKKKLDTEMGLGQDFMMFLDDIENIVTSKKDDKDYSHKRRKFEDDSSEENKSENEDQQEFDEEINNQQEDEDEGDQEVDDEPQKQEEGEGDFNEEEQDDEDEEEEDDDNDNQNQQTETKKLDLAKQVIDKAHENEQLIEKDIRAELNKLSDGNMDMIFKNLNEKIMKYSRYPETLGRIYFKVFKSFCIDITMINSAILSVNCLMITALQRILGQSFFAPMIIELYKLFKESHEVILLKGESLQHQIVIKNIISIVTHFYLFESITHTFVSDVIKHLLRSFKEKDIEMLLNLLHNIGALLRKDSPTLVKDIILLSESKKVEAKIAFAKPVLGKGGVANPLPTLTAFERKVKFLTEELDDIKNNKLDNQSKLLNSLKLYLNWLKTNSQIKSELLKNPLEVDFKILDESPAEKKWWLSEEDQAELDTNTKINEIESKIDRSYLSQLEAAAKSQRFISDIQKSVFYTLMSSEDYVDAFQSLQRLGLKKKQEREIIKVIIQCCVQEKVSNKYYSLLMKKLCDTDKSFVYSCKYTLWDYLKIIENMSIRKIVNLGRLFGFLFSTKSLPISILKFIDFYEKVNKNQRLFINVAMDEIFYDKTVEKNAKTEEDMLMASLEHIKIIFEKIKKNTSITEFKDGLSSYLSGNYYKYRSKKSDCTEKELKVLEKKTQETTQTDTTSTCDDSALKSQATASVPIVLSPSPNSDHSKDYEEYQNGISDGKIKV